MPDWLIATVDYGTSCRFCLYGVLFISLPTKTAKSFLTVFKGVNPYPFSSHYPHKFLSQVTAKSAALFRIPMFCRRSFFQSANVDQNFWGIQPDCWINDNVVFELQKLLMFAISGSAATTIAEQVIIWLPKNLLFWTCICFICMID